MKKTTLFLLFFLLALSLGSGSALANSAPTSWQGVPGWEMRTVDENCPLEVDSEQLTFDLQNMDAEGRGGSVEAVYQMSNPTSEEIRVEMAFPLIASLSGFDLQSAGVDTTNIRVDSEEVDFQVYYGAVVENGETPEIETILTGLERTADSSLPDRGTLYTYTVTAEERLNFAIRFNLGENSWMIGENFNSWQTEAGGQARVAITCDPDQQQEQVSLFILGEEPELTIAAYEANGQWDTPTEDFTYQVEQETLSLREYVAARSDWGQSGNSQMIQARTDCILAELAEFLAENRFCDSYIISDMGYQQRAVVLTYHVDFPALSHRQISVSYGATATADGYSTPFWQYRLDYLLNPARYWADFRDLKITVLAPEHSPYIVESSVELVQTDSGVWQAELLALPPGDLIFTLCSEAEITRADIFAKAISDFFRDATYILAFFWWIILPLLALLVFCIVHRIRRQRKTRAMNHRAD